MKSLQLLVLVLIASACSVVECKLILDVLTPAHIPDDTQKLGEELGFDALTNSYPFIASGAKKPGQFWCGGSVSKFD